MHVGGAASLRLVAAAPGRQRMLRRSRELFRWARERRRQSDRFAEPRLFHQLQERWDPVMRQPETAAESAPTVMRAKKFLVFWPVISRV